MAQEISGCGAGCGALFVLVVLGLGLAFWPLFLLLAIVVLVIGVVANAAREANRQELKTLIEAADRRLRGDACRVRDCFGVVEGLSLGGDLASPKIDVRCRTVADEGGQLVGQGVHLSLTPPAEPQRLRSMGGTSRWLAAAGVSLLEELSVEAKATKAAMECLRELAWTEQALAKLDGLQGALIDTLAKAEGNELLEAAIPQLQKALQSFEGEQEKLQEALGSTSEMLHKLHDFLAVPEEIRPIISFDLDQLFDPQRFSALEQSFTDVVLLNEAFQELSRDALA
jgi:Na+-transporting methylmalonyl-CoA/oxaloacetate decarboxylase gamma subunit